MSTCLEPSVGKHEEWLRQAAEDGHAPAMHALALQCASDDERRRWLREAAHEGYIPAMYDYGLSCTNPRQKRHWLRMAADEGHVQAMYLLGMDGDDPGERRRWLRMAAEEGHVVAMYVLGLACGDLNEKRRLAGRSRPERLAAGHVGAGGIGILKSNRRHGRFPLRARGYRYSRISNRILVTFSRIPASVIGDGDRLQGRTNVSIPLLGSDFR